MPTNTAARKTARVISKKQTETALVRAIIDALEATGHMVVRVQSGRLNLGNRWMHAGAPGVPDLTVIATGGRVGFLEVKTSTGHLSPTQTLWHARAKLNGARVAVVRSVAEALETVRGWE